MKQGLDGDDSYDTQVLQTRGNKNEVRRSFLTWKAFNNYGNNKNSNWQK